MKARTARTCAKPVNYTDMLSPSDKNDHTPMNTPMASRFSPTELAQMLEELQKEISNVSETEKVELKGFDVKDVTTYEEFCRMRDSIIEKTGNPDTFDEGGRTAINVDAAAIAGAKMVIDNARSTRSFSKKLVEKSGAKEDDILYKGLSNSGGAVAAAKAVNDNRKASLLESLVDFQKQIQFKMNVLKHIDKNSTVATAKNGGKKLAREISKSDKPVTRRGRAEEADAAEENTIKKGRKRTKEEMEMTAMALKTPKQSQELNPLDDKRIYDEYAHNIASELREEQKKRRRTAPIPFNINLLDDDESQE